MLDLPAALCSGYDYCPHFRVRKPRHMELPGDGLAPESALLTATLPGTTLKRNKWKPNSQAGNGGYYTSEFPDNSNTVPELEIYRLVKISSAVIVSFLLKHHQPNVF